MEHDLLHTDIQQFVHKIILGGNHHVAIKEKVRFCPQLSNSVQTQWHTWAEMTVQYVYMQHLYAALLKDLYLAFQIAHIQANQRRRKDALFIPDRHNSIHPFHVSFDLIACGNGSNCTLLLHADTAGDIAVIHRLPDDILRQV